MGLAQQAEPTMAPVVSMAAKDQVYEQVRRGAA